MITAEQAELAKMYNNTTAKYFEGKNYEPSILLGAVAVFLYSAGKADGIRSKEEADNEARRRT